MSNERKRKTRNQQKRDQMRFVCMALAMALFGMMLMCVMVKAWAEHPAEQPVNGYEYLESIGGDPYEHFQD